jgi:hypothetical protein
VIAATSNVSQTERVDPFALQVAEAFAREWRGANGAQPFLREQTRAANACAMLG